MNSSFGRLACVVGLALVVVACAPAAPATREAASAPPAAATARPAAPTAAAPATQPAPEPQAVKLGTFFSLGAAPLLVAVERGFLAEQGLDVTIERTGSASEVMGFLGAGHLDVAAGGVSGALYNAIARDVPLKVVAPLGLTGDSLERSLNFLVVRKDLYDGGVRNVGQLRGRKIAITGLGSTNHWHLARQLQAAGLGLDDVDVVDMTYPDMITALRTGALDAAIMASPFDVQLKRDGITEMLVPNVAPGQMVTVLMYGPPFMAEHPDAARRFLVGYANAIRAIQREGLMASENVPIYERYTGMKAEDLLIATPPLFDPDLRIDAQPLLEYQQFLFNEKAVSYPTPLTEQKIVDRSFATYALQHAAP
ncbi:MAG TPA: ABC transporter substrate-binding protein [Chloroflexota bacterium]|jgi:NitT/TauT family transport system substrate-binding protein